MINIARLARETGCADSQGIGAGFVKAYRDAVLSYVPTATLSRERQVGGIHWSQPERRRVPQNAGAPQDGATPKLGAAAGPMWRPRNAGLWGWDYEFESVSRHEQNPRESAILAELNTGTS